MRFKREIFFTLILFLMIFSISFVSANELTQGLNTDDSGNLSLSNDIDMGVDSIVDSSSSVLGLSDEVQNANEIDSCLTEKVPILRVSNDKPVLRAGTPHIDNYTFADGGTAQQVIDRIKTLSDEYGNSGGAVLYLNGKEYNGTGTLRTNWGDQPNYMYNISNVKVIGGTVSQPTLMATFTTTNGIALNFRGNSKDWGTKFFADSGYNLKNVSFYYLQSNDKFLQFAGGSITDCVVDHCQSVKQFVNLIGCSENGKRPIYVTNCNFTNCNQTYGFNPEPNYDDYYDGNGQFGAVLGAAFDNCNFINITSGHHGGALCIADESEYGPGNVTTTVYNTKFINITSRWFAIYLHGKFKTTTGELDSPEEIINCTFENCNATGEYAGGIGLSHSDVIIKNCNFTNCGGGQGSAIMVGGIDKQHDAFNGENFEADRVKIINCIFTNNTASLDKGYTYCTGWVPYNGPHDQKNSSRAYGWRDGNGGYNISGYGTDSDPSCNWELKHAPKNYTPSGNAGAIYVVGDYTEIIDCLFDGNLAKSGNGAAIYIIGERTYINNCEFKNHECDNGTVYIVGDNTKIANSNFTHNNASSNGAAVYINGNHGNLTSNAFNDNTAYNQGGAVYIEGNNAWVSHNNFTDNEAIPQGNSSSGTTGLGGAMYILGNDALSGENNYLHNVARNGSAIYSSGNNLGLYYDNFDENQAWSYLLIITPDPEKSLYNTSDVNVTVVHVGGDNIINAIHNNASNEQIHLSLVKYRNSRNQTVTTGWEQMPVNGAEQSEGGTILYQDDREFLQSIHVQVEHEDGEIIYPDTELITDIYGQVNVTLRKPLRVGNYDVNAYHPEDWNYKYIKNNDIFTVYYLLNLTVNKTATPDHVYVGDTVVFTINVTNSGPTNATNVNITDIVPTQFTVINCSDSRFVNNTLIVDYLAAGHSVVFNITTIALMNGTWNNTAYAFCAENDTVVNDTANVTVYQPNLTVEKISVTPVVYVGEQTVFTVVVSNTGDCGLGSVYVVENVPDDLIYAGYTNGTGNWNVRKINDTAYNFTLVGDLAKDGVVSFNVIFNTTVNGTFTNVVVAGSNVTNETSADNVTRVLGPGLTVEKIALNESVIIGDYVYFTVVVSNTGDCDLTDVNVFEIFDSDELRLEDFTGANWTRDGDVFTHNGVLAKGATDSFTVWFTTLVNGTLVNTVNATSNETDNKTTNNNTRVYRPNMTVEKITLNKTAYVGNETEFLIVVTNTGDCDLGDIKVTEIYDTNEFEYAKYIGDKWSKSGDVFSYAGNLTAGESANFTVILKVLVNGTLTNTVNASSNLTDNKTTYNSTKVFKPNMTVEKIALNESVYVGDETRFLIVVINIGDCDLGDIKVAEIYDSNQFAYVNYIGDKWSKSGDVFSYAGNLTAGESANFTIIFKTLVNGTLVNTVNASSNITGNKTSNDTVTVIPVADLKIIKDVDKDNVKVGDKVTFTIVVINNGPNCAVNAVAYDILPEGLKLISYEVSYGTYDSEKGIWKIGDLKSGENVSLTIVAEALIKGEIVNRANVTSDTYDPNESNNHDNATVSVNETVPLPPEVPEVPKCPTMHATGNPIVMILLSLLAMVGLSLRKKS